MRKLSEYQIKSKMTLSYCDCQGVINNMADEKNSNWIRIMRDAMEALAYGMKDNIWRKAKILAVRLGKKIAGIYLVFIGLVFSLIAISLLVNSFLAEDLDWIGWGIVGLFMAGIGYLLMKR